MNSQRGSIQRKPFAQSMAALHSSLTLPSRVAFAPPKRQGKHSRQGLVVRADLFGGVQRFFGGGSKEPADDTPMKLSSSTPEDVRRLVQDFDVSDSAPRLALSQEEVQLRISALLNGADSDAARKAKSASAVLEQLAEGGSGSNRLAFAAAQDELRWSQVYTSTLDTNQARAEALVRSRLGWRLARRAGPRVIVTPGRCQCFSDTAFSCAVRLTHLALSRPCLSDPWLLGGGRAGPDQPLCGRQPDVVGPHHLTGACLPLRRGTSVVGHHRAGGAPPHADSSRGGDDDAGWHHTVGGCGRLD